jgi:hypothetical protein
MNSDDVFYMGLFLMVCGFILMVATLAIGA